MLRRGTRSPFDVRRALWWPRPVDEDALTEAAALLLGEHAFTRFIEIKRKEWEDYRVQVTPFEIEQFLPVL